MSRARPDAAAAELLAPVLDVLTVGLAALDGPPLSIVLGDVSASEAVFWQRDGDRVVLSAALAGPGMQHPAEDAAFALDRWRRAAASVLEAAAPNADPTLPAWWRVGAAIDAADRAARDLGVGDAAVAEAIRTGDPGRHPRAGAAVFRWWRERGVEPSLPDAAAWLAIGHAILDPAWARLPAPVDRIAAVDIPATLTAWSWRPLDVPAHPRGGNVVIDGDAAVGSAWAIARAPLRTLAAAIGPATLRPGLGGPIGRWALRSAHGFGQVFGARGLTYRFRGSGALDVELAAAFVGPVGAIEMAERVGTSGTATGTWGVAGPHAIKLDRIVPLGLTMHGPQSRSFAVPSAEFGLGPMLRAMEQDVWTWEIDGDRLVLHGRIMGGPVEIRLQRDGE